MGKIKVLDEYTANKIAAGEVVERPASIVKELIENSIDAGSTKITIEITGGGMESITVQDNGEGMSREDAVLSFSRHATSKINTDVDLDAISTLGFRGEALPSIASVAAVKLQTRLHQELTGTFLYLAKGEVTEVKDIGCPAGTTITVTDVFSTVPARLKSLKNPSLEAGHISDVVNRLAIAYPQISFHLVHNNKTLLRTPGTDDLLSIVAAVYGTETARALLPVRHALEGMTVEGFVSTPSLSRSNRNSQVLVINGRVVKNRQLSMALEGVYHSRLMTGRYPMAFLKYKVAFEQVDPNVHPSKAEVRLYELDQIVTLTERAVKEALSKKCLIPEALPKSYTTQRKAAENFEQQAITAAWEKREPYDCANAKDCIDAKDIPESEQITSNGNTEGNRNCPEINQDSGAEGEKKDEKKGYRFPELRPIGQIDCTYIVAQGDNEGMYLVDQHAAHERILYEQNMRPEGEVYSQMLAVPETVELTHLEAGLLVTNIIHFHDVGFIVEHFGGDSFLLRGVPKGFQPGSEKKIFLDLLDYFFNNKHKLSNEQMKEELLIMTSCKAALKAGDKLTFGQMEALLRTLEQTENPFTCPHGRPTTVHLSGYELEKMFKRVL